MLRMSARRLSAFALAFSLIMGLALQGVQASQMRAAMTAGAMSAAMSDGCDGCDQGGMSAASCTAMCAAVLADFQVAGAIETAALASSYLAMIVRGADLRRPPDPFPPKSIVLN